MPFLVIDRDTAEPAPATTLGEPLTNEGMTLTEMEQELILQMEGRTDISTAQYRRLINLSYTDICTSLDIDELKGSVGITLVPGQPLYRLPYAVSTIIGASLVLPESENINGGYPLDKMDLAAYRSMQLKDGDPKFFFRMTDVLVVWPTPDEARTVALDVRIRPLWMADPSDSPIIGLEWHEGIILGARRRGFSNSLEWDKAAPVNNEFVEFMRRRTDRKAVEEEGRAIGSSVPTRSRHLRNKVNRLSDEL